MEQLAIDYSGRALAEAGMAQTLEAEREGWLDAAMSAVREFGAGIEFKTEDFRAWYERRGGSPHDHHVWGAFTNRACKAGVLKWTGRYEPSQSPKTHGHPVKVWRLA